MPLSPDPEPAPRLPVEGTLTLAAATPDDIPTLCSLAHRIWHAHYPGIITTEQIDYMLGRFFRPEQLREELARGAIWELASLGGTPVGFIACLLETSPSLRLKLSKLYLISELHGRGLGQQLLARVSTLAAAHGAHEIHLTVNKRNTKALRAYERAGFKRTAEVVTDIGQGYVMDDYILTRRVLLGDAGDVRKL